MKPTFSTAEACAKTPRGLTLLEFIVAMVILGIALAGMYPLVAIMSRSMRPLRDKSDPKTLKYVSPARDWDYDAANAAGEKRHTWYLLPFNEPWARKLGAGARVSRDETAFTAYTAASIEPASLGPVTPEHGAPAYVETGADWQAPSNVSHYHAVLASDSTEVCNVVWTLTVETTGWYWIQAGWPSDTGLNLATNVGYTVTPSISGQTNPIAINQSAVSPRIQEGAANYYWYNISNQPVKINADSGPVAVTVQLDVPKDDAQAGKQAVAAGVRLVQNDVMVETLTRTPNSETAAAGVSVTVKVPK